MADLRDFTGKNKKFTGTDGIEMPAGTTAERPGSPAQGTMRYNTQLGFMEQYNATGWAGIDAPPVVTNQTGVIRADTDVTITVDGSNFKSGSVVYVTGAGVNNVERALATTFVNSSELTADTNAASVNYIGGASYGIKVVNPSGLSAVLDPAGTVDRNPTWSTSAGNIATWTDRDGSQSASTSATDPDGDTITYSLVSGSLPGNSNLNTSTGAITSSDPTDVASSTTYSFTLGATGAGVTINRSFNIIVNPTADGSSAARAVASPAVLRSLGITTNGGYWIKPAGQTAYQTYVRFNYLDGNDWMLLLKVHNSNDMTSGNGFWTNASLNNENDMNLTSGSWSKYGIWNTVTFTRIAMEMGAGRVYPIMIFNTGRTMFNFINGNSPGSGFAGYAANSTDPSMGTNLSYDSFPMKQGSNVSLQTGNERYRQMWGINSWANASSNGNPDCRGYASVGRAGAWVGCPLDEGGHTFNNSSNGGADSGIGIGGGAGNSARTWSSGYGEWAAGCSVVDLLPGYLWVR